MKFNESSTVVRTYNIPTEEIAARCLIKGRISDVTLYRDHLEITTHEKVTE